MSNKISTKAIPMLLAVAVLAACTTPIGNADQQPDAMSGKLTGTVTYRERIALEADAVIEVQLLDVSKADAPAEVIATQTIKSDGKQVPIPFELDYDTAEIDQKSSYSLQARILVDGQLRWISEQVYPVLTQGQPTNAVEIIVNRVPGGDVGIPDQEWTLQSMIIDGTEIALESGVSTTIRFAADGKYGGSGGCNSYTGLYTLQGNTISLGAAAATLMLCQTGMDQETNFFAALETLSSFEIAADSLQLSSADGKTMLTFGAGAESQSITDVIWKWTESLDNNDKATTVSEPEKYTIEFKSDGTIALRADCNTGTGSYQLDDNQLTITLGAITLVGCPSASLDRQYLDELAEVASYLFDDQDLILEWKFDSGTMRFSR